MTEEIATAGTPHIHCLCTENTAGEPMCCKCLRTISQLKQDIPYLRKDYYFRVGEVK